MGRINYNADLNPLLTEIGLGDAQVINITSVTDNPFDWLGIIERSACFIGIDSFFVNVVDQLKLQVPKYFIRRSPVHFTPVLGGNWNYLPIQLATDQPHELQF